MYFVLKEGLELAVHSSLITAKASFTFCFEESFKALKNMKIKYCSYLLE